jgi:microcystin synthetase protein McyJ
MNIVRNALGLYRLLVHGETSALFDFVGDDVVPFHNEGFRDPNKPLWLNLGYWEHATTYPEAARAMAELLGAAARLGPGDRVLDVGFGFGEQHFVWIARHDVERIVGVNITASQVDRARQVVARRGLSDRIELLVGDAARLALSDASFDRVTALECAFHFDTREDFFAQAYRVLRPGGRLATLDMLPAPGQHHSGIRRRVVRKLSAFQEANMYDRETYCAKLAKAGFEGIEARSIREQVYPGYTKYKRLRDSGALMHEARVAVNEGARPQFDEAVRDFEVYLGISDYVLFVADKPA